MPACVPKPKPVGSTRVASSATLPFEPVELRIHPLTRIRESDGGLGQSIDLYFELLDRWGHGVKAPGTITVELRSVSAGGQREPFQVRSWTVVLTDPATNSAAYDRVTHTYHIVLEDVPAGNGASEIAVHFRASGTRQISSTYELR